jgi:AcrR family transcriptional regulator
VESSKRECILDAAAKCFSRLGFRKASIDEIAGLAGVAKGTVYLACKNKEDLFYQAVLRELHGWIGQLARLIDPRTPADQLLETLAVTAIEYFESHPLVRNLFVGVAYGELPGWAARLDDLRALGRANLEEILRLGIRQGVFRPDLEVADTATVLQDMQHAAYVLQARSGQLDPAEVGRRLKIGLRLVMDGLRRREPAAQPAPG